MVEWILFFFRRLSVVMCRVKLDCVRRHAFRETPYKTMIVKCCFHGCPFITTGFSALYSGVCCVCVCAIRTRRRNALNFIVFKAYCLVWHAFTLLFGIVAGLCAKGHHIQFSQSHRIDREPCGSTIVAKQHSQTIQMAPDRLTHTGTK